jgi:hypothetical protein
VPNGFRDAGHGALGGIRIGLSMSRDADHRRSRAEGTGDRAVGELFLVARGILWLPSIYIDVACR